ncbi:hypothetical protein [Mycetocola lacteus]|uniref:hypothetical protein n=1 Tax=Mycetocola lacteus TaxID=76637 RepID=UPI0015FFD1F4|nr:hypothetical protein [Mycetocola lacteus]
MTAHEPKLRGERYALKFPLEPSAEDDRTELPQLTRAFHVREFLPLFNVRL